MSRTLHVLQGDSAAGCFIQALHPKRAFLLVNQDVLSCGPLPGFESAEQWTRLRGEYWDSVGWDGQPPSTFNSDFLQTISSIDETDSLVFWLGTGIAEQLMLAWSMHLLRLVRSRAKVSVVQFIRVKDRMDVWGLGLLNPDQIANHPPIEPLSCDAIQELQRYWAALTAPDPTELLSLLAGASTHVPHFRSSLNTLLLRYPDPGTGLGRWDREILKYIQEKGPSVVQVIGHVMGYNLDTELRGDGPLFLRLRGLAAPNRAHPLVSLSGNPREMRDCRATVTAVGEQVLAGRANAIEL
ncbi:MAG TPA: DUF1835 domain-containing protein, partial [Bryobacteraceae bacterium]